MHAPFSFWTTSGFQNQKLSLEKPHGTSFFIRCSHRNNQMLEGTNPMKRSSILFFVLAFFASQFSYAQTELFWTAVPMPVFFDYSTTAQAQPSANGPYNFNFPGAGGNFNDTSGCYFNQFASSAANPKRPYWFINGVAASGVIPRHSPSVGTVFEDPVQVGTAMRGFSFLGSFNSSTTYSALYDHLIGSVYWSDEFCYDGTTEYGFSHDYVRNTTIFYFGSNQNCQNDGTQFCRQDNNSTSQVAYACSGGVLIPSNIQGNTYYYNAFVFQDGPTYKFKVELLDPTSLVPAFSCTIDPGLTGDQPFRTACNLATGFSANTCSNFSAAPLYYNYGSITAGIDGGSPSTWVTGLQISTVKAAK
jgi:hypothetical protein